MHKSIGGYLVLLGMALLLLAPASFAQESLAEAARKAREKKKQQQPAAKVYTNDNLPTTGAVSVVGSAPQPVAADKKTEGKEGEGEEEKGEDYWRARFAEARRQLEQAEKELDVLQRELEVKRIQYFDDPQKTMHEELERKEVNEHRQKIEAKQQEVARLRQAFSDLEDELRRAGGNPGWSRP